MTEIQKKITEGIHHFHRKSYDESKTCFNNVLDIDASNPEASYYLGLMYTKESNYIKAVLYLKSIVDTSINYIFTPQCRMLLGFIYYKNSEYDRAENEFLEALKVNYEPIKAHAALASVYYKQERFEAALTEANKAHSLDSFNLNAKNTYGFLLCDLDIDAEKGVELLRDVVRLKPDNPAYIDSLGWGYYKKGDLKSSIDTLKTALSISSNDEIKEHYNIVMGLKKVPTRTN